MTNTKGKFKGRNLQIPNTLHDRIMKENVSANIKRIENKKTKLNSTDEILTLLDEAVTAREKKRNRKRKNN